MHVEDVQPAIAELRAALADRYTIGEEIGRGGMAVVHRARDLRHDRDVALKVLPSGTTSEAERSRFLDEIRRTAALHHPHVVPLFDSGHAGGTLYYAMPLMQGSSLRDHLRREPRLPVAEAMRVAAEVADGLAHAHARDIVHRDIKPENILLTAGHAQVADFGIGRVMATLGPTRERTQTGVLLGTPTYMSPEQIEARHELDGRSDLYSLGCVLFEMLSGQPPFPGASTAQVMSDHLTRQPPDLGTLRPEVPSHVRAIVARCLAKDPAARFADAGALRRAILEPGTVATGARFAAPGTWPRRVRVAALALAGVAVVMTALAATGVIRPWRNRTPTGPAAVSPSRIAILPFAYHGPADQSYLGSGATTLLRHGLDGAGPLRVIDAAATERTLASSGDEPGADQRAALALGASALVRGVVYVFGDRVRIEAAIVETGDEPEVPQERSSEGDLTELPVLVERLAREVLQLRAPPGTPLPRARGAGAGVPFRAVKAYLQAEDASQKGLDDAALQKIDEALAADSSFALAWAARATYQVNRGDFAGARGSAEHAVAHAEGLPRQENLRARTVHGYVWGEADAGERAARSLVEEYPDDAAGWKLLARLLVTYNSYRGRRANEVIPVCEQALRRDSLDTIMLWVVALRLDDPGRLAYLDTLEGRARAAQGPEDIVSSLRLKRAHLAGDRAGFERELRNADRPDALGLVWVAERTLWNSGDWHRATDLLDRAARAATDPELEAGYRVFGAASYGAVGQRGRAGITLDAVRRVQPELGVLYAGMVAIALAPWIPPDELDALDRDLARLDTAPGEVSRVGPRAAFEAIEAPLPTARDYVRGMLAAARGNRPTALASAAALEPRTGDAYVDGWRATHAAGIRARLAWTEGDAPAALRFLEAAGVRSQPGGRVAFRTWTHERFLRAQALHALGRSDEALRWLATVGDLFVFDRIYAPQVQALRSRIEKDLGNPAAARASARRGLAMLDRCDPEFEPLRARLAQLAGDGPAGAGSTPETSARRSP